MKSFQNISPETIRRFLELERIGNIALTKAHEENRRLGIPNWYSINGKIISDQQIEQMADQNSKK